MIAKTTAVAGLVALTLVVGPATATYPGGAEAAARPGTRAHSTAVLTSIDANTDPSAAGQALNTYCEPATNCHYTGTPSQVVALGPQRAIGDEVYNCNDPTVKGLGPNGLEVEDEVTLSDERGEATNTEESISGSVQVGILKVEAEVFTKQYEKVSTTTTKTATVPVVAGYEGWLNTQVPTLTVSGTITDGIHFQVTDFRLTYPGYGQGDLLELVPTPYGQPLDDPAAKPARADRATHCDHLPPIVVPPGGIKVTRPAPGPTISVCVSGRRKCHVRKIVAGAGFRLPRDARVGLAHGSKIVATGIDQRGNAVVHSRRPLPAGAYTMLVSGRRHSSMLSITLH
jgi:hypothetical protein